MYAEKSLAKLATLVYHLHPDLEVGGEDWIIRVHTEVVEALGFEGIAGVMFIPSGPLRVEDFSRFGGCVDHEELYYKYGLVFIDAGYGLQPLDQHRQKDCRVQSSIERLIDLACEGGADLLWLMPLVRVIAANDLTGSETAMQDEGMKASSTPNTPRHLRNLMAGLNRIYPEQPELVLQLVHMAFNGVAKFLPGKLAELEAELDQSFAGDDDLDGMDRRIDTRARAEEKVVKRLFTWNELVANVRLAYAAKPEYLEFFENAAETAFQALEQEWVQAVADYWNPEKTRMMYGVKLDPKQFGMSGERQHVNVAIINSASTRAGQVCRLGNPQLKRRGKLRPLPFPGHETRPKADVIIQIMDENEAGTKMLVSTRGGITLLPVSYAVRLADLNKRFHCLEVDASGRLWLYAGSGRRANKLASQIRERCGLEVRPSGEYVQFRCQTGEQISDVARQLQRLGGDKSVIVLDQSAFQQLAEAGNNLITVRNARWEEVSVSVQYLADFLSSMGCGHNTNPFARRCALTPGQIVTTVLSTLRGTHAAMEESAETATSAS